MTEKILNNLKKISKSATLLLNEQSRNLEATGKDIYKLGFGQSPFSPPEHVIEELRQNAHEHFYSPVQGITRLCETVAKFHRIVDGIDVSREDVFIAPGSKALIYSVLNCFSTANVFIPSPAWVSYAPQAKMCQHRIYRIRTSFEKKWRVTAEDLEKVFASVGETDLPNILILNYPGNPEGVTYSKDELKEISDVLRKNEVIVISDEIYGLINHEGNHETIAKYYPEQTIMTTGLSKWCGAGGWRLGVAILSPQFPKELKQTLIGVASEIYSCNSTPVQLAAIEAYQPNQLIWDYIKHQRRILKLIGNYSHEVLEANNIQNHEPEGGFYLFPDFSSFKEKLNKKGLMNSADMCAKLLQDTGVAILPASSFGFEDDYMAARISYTDFDGDTALKASRVLTLENELTKDFADKYAIKVINGVKRIGDWFNSL